MPSTAAPLQLELFPSGTSADAAPEGGPPAPDRTALAIPASEKRESEGDPGRAAALEHRLAGLLDEELRRLTLTDNRTRIVSARPAVEGGLEVRIHRCFATASDAVLRSVADFLSSRRRGPARRRALRAIREHFARHRPQAAASGPRPRRTVLRPVGETLDLRIVRDELNRAYFDGALEVHVTWGRRSAGLKRRSRRGGFSIRLGSYDERRNVVRIHRCLDHPRVPRWVVESVVYHEMLHAALPIRRVEGRRRIHTPEFRRRERLFRHHEKAERWIADHLEWLAKRR